MCKLAETIPPIATIAITLASLTLNCSGSSGNAGPSQCRRGDLRALLRFKAGIIFDNSGRLRSWNFDNSGRLRSWNGFNCCQWQELSCNNQTGRVVELRLSGLLSGNDFLFDSEMKGKLSESLGDLQFLEILNLGDLKEITGPIPSSLGKLRQLKKLILNRNKLSGSIPPSPKNLHNLQELYLSESELSGSIPDIFGGLQNFSVLDLFSNTLTGQVPASIPSLCVQGIFEFEEAITDISSYKKACANALLSSNPLFSCKMKEDDRGVLRWQRTTVNTDDHTIIAEFTPVEESYDAIVDEYICKLTLTSLDQSRPLWELHFLNYKTSKAGATMVVKIHHSLGDGISLMSALFSIFRRVDNPHLPPTFPTAKRSIKSSSSNITVAKLFHRLWHMMLVLWYTLVDVISCILRMIGWIDDSQLPIRGPSGVEDMPVALHSATFPLEDIKQIKNSVGGTVNDVISGIIFSGMQRYLQISLSVVGEHGLQDAYKKRFEPSKDAVIKQLKNSKLTALSMINTRAMAGLQNMDEMLKPKAQVPWGNHFGFLPVRLPLMEKLENPLDFVRMAKQTVDRHKISLGVFLVAKLPKYIAMLKGQQAISRYLYNTLSNTTMMLSNMIGPMEKVAIHGNPIKSFSFFVTGLPQALGVFIVSYMDVVLVQVHAHKDYVDADILLNCFMEAFDEIKQSQFDGSV